MKGGEGKREKGDGKRDIPVDGTHLSFHSNEVVVAESRYVRECTIGLVEEGGVGKLGARREISIDCVVLAGGTRRDVGETATGGDEGVWVGACSLCKGDNVREVIGGWEEYEMERRGVGRE